MLFCNAWNFREFERESKNSVSVQTRQQTVLVVDGMMLKPNKKILKIVWMLPHNFVVCQTKETCSWLPKKTYQSELKPGTSPFQAFCATL